MADHELIDAWELDEQIWTIGPDPLVDSWEWDDQFKFTNYDLVDSWTWEDIFEVTSYDLVDSWTFDDFISGPPIEQYDLVDSWTLDESVVVVTTDLDDYADDTPDGLYEEPENRSRSIEEREYGRVIIYGRVFTCAKGDAEGFENGVLSPGSIMREQWADPDDDPSRFADGPRVLTSQRKQRSGTGMEAIQVVYLAFLLPNTRRAGYNETARSQPRAESALRSLITVHGITTDIGASNMPTKGSALDGGSAVCLGVSYNDTSLPGRILVTSEYRLPDEAVGPLKANPMPIVGTGPFPQTAPDLFPSRNRMDLWAEMYGYHWWQSYREHFGL